MAKPPVTYAPMPYGNTIMPSAPNVGVGVQQNFDPTAGLPLQRTPQTPQSPQSPQAAPAMGGIYHNSATGEMWVNGRVFSLDDETAAAESLNWLAEAPAAEGPSGAGWSAVRPDEYRSFVQEIVDPSMGRLASRNFGRGIDNLQMLAGAGLSFLGAKETGANIIAQQDEDLSKTAVYDRRASEIGTSQYGAERGVADWFVAVLAQQGPNLVESVVTGALGAIGGSAAAGPVGTVAGGLAGVVGKQAFKKSLVEAAKKYTAAKAAGPAAAKTFMGTAEGAFLKRTAAITGAAVATTGSSYGMGVSDIYLEGIEQGDPSRGAAAAGAVPYAALESLSEFALAAKVFNIRGLGRIGSGTVPEGASRLRRGAARAGQATRGAAAGSLLEGTTELGQEALVMGLNDVDMSSPESATRFWDSFLAGAAVGGGIGGIANTMRRPVDVLKRDTVSTPSEAQGELFPGTSLGTAPENVLPSAANEQASTQPPMGEQGELPFEFGVEGAANINSAMDELGNVAYYDSLEQRDLFQSDMDAQSAVDDAFSGVTGESLLPAQPAAQPASQPVTRLTAPDKGRVGAGERFNIFIESPEGNTLAMKGSFPYPTVLKVDPLERGTRIGIDKDELTAMVARDFPEAKVLNATRFMTDLDAWRAKNGVQQTAQPAAQVAPETPSNTQQSQALINLLRGREAASAPAQPTNIQGELPFDSGLRPSLMEPRSQPTPIADTGPVNTQMAEQLAPLARKQKREAEQARAAGVPESEVQKIDYEALERANKADYADAVTVWDYYASDTSSVTFDMLTAKAQADWVQAVKDGSVSERLYKAMRMRADPKKKGKAQAKPPKLAKSKPKKAAPKKPKLAKGKPKEEAKAPTKKSSPKESADAKPVPSKKKAPSGTVSRTTGKAEIHDPETKRSDQTVKSSDALDDPIQGVNQYIDGVGGADAMAGTSVAYVLDIAQTPKHPDSQAANEFVDTLADDGFGYAINDADARADFAHRSRRVFYRALDEALKTQDQRIYKPILAIPGFRDFFLVDIDSRAPKLLQDLKKKYETDADTKKLFDDAAKKNPSQFSLADLDSMDVLNENGNPAKPLGHGNVVLRTKQLLSKYANKPNVKVFKNQADMREKAPDLYREAKALRRRDDFDTALAAAVAFGDNNVVIFSDRIMGNQHLKTVLAHEAIGHLGFRAVVPPGKLNSVLDTIFDGLPQDYKVDVETRQALGLNRREATEEFLADMAGALEASILKKFINAIKSFLNRVGISFEDDHIRYWVNQSRRYAKSGGNWFVNSEFAGKSFAFATGRTPMPAMFSIPSAINIAVDTANTHMYDPKPDVSLRGMLSRLRDGTFDSAEVMGTFLDKLKLGNYHARENWGLETVHRAARDMISDARSTLGMFQKNMHTFLDNAFEIPGSGIKVGSGLSSEERTVLNNLLRFHTRHFENALERSPELKKELDSLLEYDPETGKVKIKPGAPERLASMAKFSLADLQKGVTYTKSYYRPYTAKELAALRKATDDKIAKLGTSKKDQAAQAKYEREFKEAEATGVLQDGEVVKLPHDLKGITKDSNIWKAYNEAVDTLAEGYALRARSTFDKIDTSWEGVFGKIALIQKRKSGLSKEDKKFLKFIYRRMHAIMFDGAVVDEVGIPQPTDEALHNAEMFRERVNAAIIGRDTDRLDTTGDEARVRGPLHEDVAEKYWGKDADLKEIRKRFEAFRRNNKALQNLEGDERFIVQNELDSLDMVDRGRLSDVRNAAKEILTGYIQITRRGDHEVRAYVVDAKTGKTLTVHQTMKGVLPYFQTEGQSRAKRLSETLNKEYAQETYKMLVRDEDGEYALRDVKIQTQARTVQQLPDDGVRASVHDLLHLVKRYGISLRPAQRERIVKSLTGQNDRARKRFRREGIIGEDADMIRNVAEQLETMASHIARNRHQHKIDAVLEAPVDDAVWSGNAAKLKELEKAYKANPGDRDAEMAYRDYAYKFTTKDAKRRGGYYKDRAVRLDHNMNRQHNLIAHEFGADGVFGAVRNFTAVAYLGGSVAQMVLNWLGFFTNVVPSLITYNTKTNFGGGHGIGAVMAEFSSSAKSVGGISRNKWEDFEALNDPKNHKLREKLGLSEGDVEFLVEYIQSGRGDAALTNALMNRTRGRQRAGAIEKTTNLFMYPFMLSEMQTRRMAGLMAYRLYLKDRVKPNMSEAARKALHDKAARHAMDFSDATLGDYSNASLPTLFQSGFGQLIFMFKVWPVMSSMLMANLPWSGRLAMIAALFALGGLKGVPFSEDFFDLLDTIAQRVLGLGIGSVEKKIYELVDGAVPGAGHYFMYGMVQEFVGASIASRTQLGNILPGTEVFLPGADVGREIIDMFGPAASASFDLLSTGTDTLAYALEATGIKTGNMTIQDILRGNPVTMGRAVGDMWAYADTGAIVNSRGYKVSDDLSAMTYVWRSLGFYPAAAAESFQKTRLLKRESNYSVEVSTAFRLAWVNATLRGDHKRARNISEQVREWNKRVGNKSSLYVSNFEQRARRALKEARTTNEQRTVKATNRTGREQAADLFAM